ncbi:MAG: SusC/RagA family TonB-linked outer membrane protein, partial [Bacteroidales bacterium]|nr:SusC/RagA family TonB-linked outer membrane protein [Bacteroidales bacterium]
MIKKIYIIALLIVLGVVYLPGYGQDNSENVVTGTVTDATTGEVLIGVNVFVSGTSKGTITDIDGKYRLLLTSADTMLTFSYVGYKNFDVLVNSRTIIDAILELHSEQLDDVVVVAYGVKRKVDVTGSISSISSEEIAEIPTPNVAAAMQGKAAGLQIIPNSGSPGAEVSVKIRGTGTTNNSDPLYIVDGFIVESIQHINPDDIKDIQILKDAASAAIYGARAANGVVLISTKKGKEGKVKVQFSANWGMSEFWNRPEVLDKYEYRDLFDSAYVKANLLNNIEDSTKFYDYAVNDWMDLIIRDGSNQKYNLVISGGNERNKYLLSGNWNEQTGIVEKTDFRKASVRFNMENKLSDYFTVNSQAIVSSSKRNKIQENEHNSFQYALSAPPSNTLHPGGAFTFLGDSLLAVDEGSIEWNPYGRLLQANQDTRKDQFILNLSLTTKLGKLFSNTTRAQYDMLFTQDNDFRQRNEADYLYFYGIKFDDNSMEKKEHRRMKWQFEDFMNLQKDIGEHKMAMVLGISLEGFDKQTLKGKKSMAVGKSISYQSINAAYLNPIAEDSYESWTAMGVPFRFDYNYQSKYYFQFNYRADASS